MNNELQNSINYIKSKAGNKPGFSIPTDYIEGIEDHFFFKLKEKELPKESPFDVPTAYFDNLEANILSKTVLKEKKVKVISLKSKFLKYSSIAVAASLLLFVSSVFFNTQKNNTNISFEDISLIDIEDWLDETSTYTNNEIAFNFEDILDDNELIIASITIEDDAIEDYFSSIDNYDLITEIQ